MGKVVSTALAYGTWLRAFTCCHCWNFKYLHGCHYRGRTSCVSLCSDLKKKLFNVYPFF